MNQKQTKIRFQKGSVLLELPIALWIIFAILFVPLVGLVSINIRGTIMDAIVKDAVHAASKARTFNTSSADGPSAVESAQSVVSQRLAGFPGISASQINTRIILTDITSGSISRSNSPLTLVDSSRFIYQVETAVTGQVDPLFGGNSAIFGNLPGFTSPLPVQYSAREMFENPQGLNR